MMGEVLRRRSVELVLIVAIATLQCVSTAAVDDARQPTQDGRTIVAATAAHGGVGVARIKGTVPLILSGVVTDTFVLTAPVFSSGISRAEAAVRIRASVVEIPQAPRPPPALG